MYFYTVKKNEILFKINFEIHHENIFSSIFIYAKSRWNENQGQGQPAPFIGGDENWGRAVTKKNNGRR